MGINGWNVITKLPSLPSGCQAVGPWVKAQIEQSLSRLGIQQLQGVLLHRPDDLFGENGKSLVKALKELKAEGLTRQVGVSVYGPEELEKLTSLMTLDLVQTPLNILDRRLVSSGWASRLKDRGTELHVRSTFLSYVNHISNSNSGSTRKWGFSAFHGKRKNLTVKCGASRRTLPP